MENIVKLLAELRNNITRGKLLNFEKKVDLLRQKKALTELSKSDMTTLGQKAADVLNDKK